MNINIICVGKLREKYWVAAAAEYAKRISSYCILNTVEVKEDADIPKRIKPSDYVITLEIKGTPLSSEAFAAKIEKLAIDGKSTIDFIIGGAEGLSGEVRKRADFKLSFSEMTFPHQMMRIILLEQIYRCFKIIRNEAYHK